MGIKIGLKYTGPLHFAGVRFVLSGLFIAPFIPNFREQVRAIRHTYPILIAVAFVQTVFQYSVFYMGMEYVPGALGAMIIGSGPLFIALIAHFLIPTDRLTKHKAGSIAFGLVGVAILTLGRNEMGVVGPMVGVGILLLFANNTLAGLGNVLVATDKRRVPPLVLSSFSMFFGGLVLLIISIPFEGIPVGPFELEYYLALGWLSFLSATAFSIWYTLLRRPGVKVSELNLWKFIIPVLGAVLSWVMLPDEHPTLIAIIGMVFVAFSLVTLNRQTTKKGL